MANFMTTYSTLLVSVDDSFQLQESRVALSHSVNSLVTVEVDYCVPSSGFEFDPREEIGSNRRFRVGIYRTTGGKIPRATEKLSESTEVEKVIVLPMRVVGWTLEGGVGNVTRARVTFEEANE